MGGVRRTDPKTSKMAYESMKADGTLSKRRLEAIHCLANLCPYPPTVGEMAKVMRTNRNNLATRMTELEHLGIVLKVGERECKVTDKTCLTWGMTGETTPTGEIPKNINTTEIIRGQRDKANAQVIELLTLISEVADWLEATGHKKAVARIKVRLEEARSRKSQPKPGVCSTWEDHEWKKQDNGYFRCTKCPFEKTAAEITLMGGQTDAKKEV